MPEQNTQYQQTLDYLFNALPAYQNQGKSAYKENLDNTYALMQVLDHPHTKFKSIHIAGTNGKGSVSHILAAIFQRCGYKTGLYTSPHLLDFRERIRINGEMINEQAVIDFTAQNKSAFEEIKPSFFEMTVALAFETFAKEKVDIAIVETGMGGRLDSTNILKPEAAIITNISMDHAQFLGDTLEQISSEKAGIIKSGVPTILGDLNNHLVPIFAEKAKESNSQLHLSSEKFKLVTSQDKKGLKTYTFNTEGKYFNLESDLTGIYQGGNIATALTCVDVINKAGNFHLPTAKIQKALQRIKSSTGLRGRWDVLQQKPLWIADTGHNEAGISHLMKQIDGLKQKKKYIIYGCVSDKEYSKIFDLFNTRYEYIFTQSGNMRSLESPVLMNEGAKRGFKSHLTTSVKEAIDLAKEKATDKDAVIICGSTFVVADALANFH